MKRTELILTSLLTLAALGTAGAAAKRAFLPSNAEGDYRPRPVPSASLREQLVAEGRLVIGSAGGMPIAVFSDFECPACRALHFRLKELDKSLPGELSVRYLHYPLSYHKFAMAAAKLAECADSSGRFGDVVDEVFTHQNELTDDSWEALTERAGLPNPASALACASAPDDAATFRRIAIGKALADSLELIGTPMVVVDGTVYDNPPTDAEIREMLRAFRKK